MKFAPSEEYQVSLGIERPVQTNADAGLNLGRCCLHDVWCKTIQGTELVFLPVAAMIQRAAGLNIIFDSQSPGIEPRAGAVKR